MKRAGAGRTRYRPGGRVPRNRKRRNYSALVRLYFVSALVCTLMPFSISTEPSSKARPFPTTRVKHTHVKHRVHKEWHPPHTIKVWTTVYEGKTFRVVQLPRCEHLETVIAYDPSGETLSHAKTRLNGIAACTGSFHNPRTMAIADFLQKEGAVVQGARTGRCFVAVNSNGKVHISRDYAQIKGQPDVSALALGQSLVPLQMDGFSKGFMNRDTGRMAIGTNSTYLYIVQGKTDIWRLAQFMKQKLPVTRAVNSDGGHVIQGKAPVHVVFRWKNTSSGSNMPAGLLSSNKELKGG